jgi:integrase/recombinase XerD
MSAALRSSVADYLQVRRALGFKLERDERFLNQFIDYLERRGEPTLTGELALAWATLPAGTGPGWWSSRLGAVRGFASYLQTIDPTIEMPPRVAAFGRDGRRRSSPPTPTSQPSCGPPKASCSPWASRPTRR